MKKRRSFKWFLISSIVFTVTAPVIIIGFITTHLSTDSIKQGIVLRNEILSNVLVNRIEEYLNMPYEDLLVVRGFIERNEPDTHTLSTLLNEINESHDYFIKLQIVDNSGIVVNVSPHDDEFINIDMSQQLFFKEVKRTGKKYWSPTFISPQLNLPVAALSIPFENGVITGYLSLNILTEIVRKISVGKNSFITITDQTGTFIAHFDKDQVFQRSHDINYDSFRKEFSGVIMSREVTYNREKMICNVDFINQTGWAVVIYQSGQEFFAPIKKLYYILGMGIFLILIIATLLSVIHIKNIIGILNKFINTTSIIATGAYDTVVEDVEYHEFSKLAEHFNSMTKAIRKRENKIKESEKRLAAHAQNTPLGVIEWDVDFKVREWNRAAERIFGYTKEEALGRHAYDLIVPEKSQKHVGEIWKALLQGKGGTLSVNENINQNGDLRPCEWYNTILTDSDETIIGVASLVQDISRRKTAEEELIAAQERYDSLFNSKTNIVFVMTETGNFIDVNALALELFGYKEEEISDLNYLQLLHQDQDIGIVADTMAQLLETGAQMEPIEIKMKHKDGKTLFIQSSGTLIHGRKEIIGVAHDITDQKNAEESKQKLQKQLSQAQKMESIGTLAGGIAHDFNNILSSIIGFTEICLGEAKKGSSLERNLTGVFDAGLRAAELVKQILTFSRQTEQELKPVQVNLIVNEALKLMRASLPATIEIQPDLKSDGIVMGDPTQVHQILMNLCTNASHAMEEEGGILEVGLSNVGIESDIFSEYPELRPGPYLMLTVSDTGYGIRPELLDNIFEPFFTTKEKHEGTGMGLSVVHGIVKSYGGVIYAYSELGEGATFKVFLPAIERRAQPEKRHKEFLPIGTEHILFVDDEEYLVDIGRQMLESLGYQVTASTSGSEALRIFTEHPEKFDIVLTDLTMPKLKGDELSKKLIVIRSDIPVVLCTGFSSKINENEAMKIGIEAYILKPILMRDLAETVRRVLDKKKEKNWDR